MNKKIKTNDGTKGGWLVGKRHYDEQGNSLGGIKAVVTDAGNRPVELEGGEVIINREASKKYWKELSRINQSAGNGVAIGPPTGADEDPEEYKDGGNVIEFNPNHLPNKWIVSYAKKIKSNHPEIWKLGGNIFGNEAFNNLERVSERGYWLDSEKWMYIKWRSYVARHQRDYHIGGVVAMLKWCDKVQKGWPYMKELIEAKIDKKGWKHNQSSKKMNDGGNVVTYKDKEGNYIGDGTYNVPYEVFDFSQYPQIESSVSMSDTTESVYVYYTNNENNERVTCRFSNHVNNAVKFGYQLNGYTASKNEILYRLGLMGRRFIPNTYLTFDKRQVKKVDLPKYQESNLTIQEIYQLGEGADISMHKGKVAKGSNWLIEDDLIKTIDDSTGIYEYFKDGGMTTKNYVSYKDKFNTKYGYTKGESHSLEEVSKDTGVSMKGLQQIYDKGIGAYKTNPQSVRPNVKSKEQWAMARVYSAVMGGKASKIDFAELKMAKGGLVASNGFKSNLTPLQYKLVRTQAFKEITCQNCGWHWNTKDSKDFDKYVCHKCGTDNSRIYAPKKHKEGGNIEWSKAKIGDSAIVVAENKMGVIVKDYGRKFHLKFVDGTEKTYDADELDFYRLDEEKYAGGGLITTYGGEAKIDDKGQLNTRKGRIDIQITNITDKWVIFNDLTDGGKRKDSPRDKFIENYRGDGVSNYSKPIVGSAVTSATTVQAKPDIYELKKSIFAPDLYNTKIYVNTPEKSKAFQKIAVELGINWHGALKKIDLGPNIVYLFIDDEFSGAQELGYSTRSNSDFFENNKNKELFFDDLFQFKGTKTIVTPTTSNKPIHELTNYRIKTEQEFINEYGSNWREDNIIWTRLMDWMFGKQITDLVREDDYNLVLEITKQGVTSFTTKNETGTYEGNWRITPNFVKYDITTGIDFSTLFPDEQKTNVKVKEISEVKTERELIHDEYNDIIFLIENTLGTDSENMLSLKAQAKELKDKLDVLDLELKKKNTGELNLLDELFSASSVKPQARYDFKSYSDGFAPDGQPTALPKNIYDWTITEEFHNWFGNFTLAYNYKNSSYENIPCSIVVNKNYEPLVVYHGTGAEFSFFKFDRFPAMYFAENEAYSNWFAEMKGQEQGTQGYVYPFILNIRTPLDLTYFEINDVSPDEFIDWMYLQTGLDADELKINKALTNPSSKHKAWMYLRNSPEMLEVLRDKNVCDGIVYYEDNPSVDVRSDAYKTKAYIVFNSNSAKIAEPSRHKLAISAMRSFYLKRGGKL